MINRVLLLTVSTALLMTGCERSESPSSQMDRSASAPGPQATHLETAHGVEWHTGDVESAFALAQQENKPLFLYWGAEWCPPCHQIKDQIFSRPEFIEKSKLFVAIYLDGDTERAQKYGDRFGVKGYPTMIVFSPDGRELTRIPGGLDIGLYAEVLDLTLEGVHPAPEIVRAVMAGEEVGPEDYQLLGFYSWSQDNDRALGDLDPVDAFRRMSEGCPEELPAAAARLYAEYLRAAIAADKDEDNPYVMSPEQKAAAIERVKIILSDEDLSRASFPLIISYSDDVVPGLTAPGTEEREALVAAWNARLDAIAADPGTFPADRLWTRYVRLLFETMDSEDEVSEAVAAEAKADVDRANEQSTSEYQRQSFMNAAWYVLTASGQSDYTRQLLMEELDKSKQPYYFMPSLAKLAEQEGDTAEALDWLKRGYDTARGPATRFQWGYYYVSGLIRLTPDDADTIASASEQLLSELDGHADAIYNRTGRIMKRLGEKLGEWNMDGSHDEQIRAIQSRLDSLCAKIPEGDEAIRSCRVFMEEA
jgi:thioredoxin-related protein